MDTFIARSQKAFGKFTFAVSIAALFVAFLTILQLHFEGAYDLKGQFELLNTQLVWRDSRRFGGSLKSPKENALFKFNADADLTPLFNWNTKQVFAYITVDYNTTNSKTGQVNSNSIVIWDRIITKKESANLHLSRATSKYHAWELQRRFMVDNNDVEFNLHWNVQPRAGFLSYGTVNMEGTSYKLRQERVTQEEQV